MGSYGIIRVQRTKSQMTSSLPELSALHAFPAAGASHSTPSLNRLPLTLQGTLCAAAIAVLLILTKLIAGAQQPVPPAAPAAIKAAHDEWKR